MTAKSVALTSVIVTPPACPARRNVVRSQVMKVKDSAIRRHAGLGGAFTRVIRCGILLGTGRHPLLVVSFGFGSHWPGNGCQLNYGHWEVGWSTCPGGNREAKADPLVACDRIRDLVGDQGAYERWSRGPQRWHAPHHCGQRHLQLLYLAIESRHRGQAGAEQRHGTAVDHPYPAAA